MKKSIKKLSFLLMLFAMILVVSSTFANDKKGPGKNTKKETVKKETKKFATVFFEYDGSGPISDPSNWTQVFSVPTPCTGGSLVCAIRFNDATYPLDENGKPNDEVLEIYEENFTDTEHESQIGSTGIFVYKRPA